MVSETQSGQTFSHRPPAQMLSCQDNTFKGFAVKSGEALHFDLTLMQKH